MKEKRVRQKYSCTYLLPDFLLCCQLEKSSVCGFITMYMIYVFTHFSLKQFISLEKLFKRNSIKTNEKLILECVQKHFKFKL